MKAIETELAKIYTLCKDIIDYYNSGNTIQTDINPSILSELEENTIVS
jgi:hypothetical protein